jgi:hypothetical protein
MAVSIDHDQAAGATECTTGGAHRSANRERLHGSSVRPERAGRTRTLTRRNLVQTVAMSLDPRFTSAPSPTVGPGRRPRGRSGTRSRLERRIWSPNGPRADTGAQGGRGPDVPRLGVGLVPRQPGRVETEHPPGLRWQLSSHLVQGSLGVAYHDRRDRPLPGRQGPGGRAPCGHSRRMGRRLAGPGRRVEVHEQVVVRQDVGRRRRFCWALAVKR